MNEQSLTSLSNSISRSVCVQNDHQVDLLLKGFTVDFTLAEHRDVKAISEHGYIHYRLLSNQENKNVPVESDDL